MTPRKNVIKIYLLSLLAALFIGGQSLAQQPDQVDLWRLAPPDALLVAGCDGRPTNPSVQAMNKSLSPEAREAQAKQNASMRKGIEDLLTLFGISLDFAKDIDTWAGNQCAIALIPEGKANVQPVLMLSSTDEAAARAAMDKLLIRPVAACR